MRLYSGEIDVDARDSRRHGRTLFLTKGTIVHHNSRMGIATDENNSAVLRRSGLGCVRRAYWSLLRRLFELR
jgi:hypothetical protein